ncbi:MAG: hypothetical protein ACM3NQ_03565, partial [Bacteroidales bacterium]
VVRPVLAPIDIEDMFGMTVEAFNIAEQYQTPVILLSDQELSQRKEAVARIDATRFTVVDRRAPTEHELEDYVRFRITESGISPISRPGMKGGNYLASGIEHTERGAPTANGEIHARMNEKRVRKFAPLKDRSDLHVVDGHPDAPIGLVSWGSLAGVALEAMRLAEAEGLRVKVLVPKLLYPVAEHFYQDFFASVTRGLVIEQSHQGQLYRLIRMFVDVPRGVEPFSRSGSNPITPQDVLERIRKQMLAIQDDYSPVQQLG